jgi:hypothetical protein
MVREKLVFHTKKKGAGSRTALAPEMHRLLIDNKNDAAFGKKLEASVAPSDLGCVGV